MNYDQMRNKAVDGDVIFLTVNRNDILSRVTSWFTKSPYTHAAFVFWYKSRLMVVESTTHGGIRIVQASTYKDRNIEILSPKIHWMDIEESAISKSGTAEYGWVSAMYIGLREFLFKYFEIKLPVNKNNRNKACSEFVAEVLNLEDTDITPRKLYEILEQSK